MRNTHTNLIGCTLAVLLLASATATAQTPLGSEWTYQGKLDLLGSPLNDTADFEFTLYDADAGGNTVGSVIAASNVTVVDGLFTVELDFGVLAFNGEARWLEINVRSPAGGGAFSTLDPRQPLTATPYAQSLAPGALIRGEPPFITGVLTVQATAPGTAFLGVADSSPDSIGVAGWSGGGSTVAGLAKGDKAVWGKSSSGWSGYFEQGDAYFADNVGIGVPNPTTALDVAGTVTATAFVGDGSSLTGVPGDNLGTHIATQALDMSGNVIASVADPVASTDAANKNYVDTLLGAQTQTHYITMTEGDYSATNPGGSCPAEWCPAGWDIVTSRTYSTRASSSRTDSAAYYSWNDWRECLCSKTE